MLISNYYEFKTFCNLRKTFLVVITKQLLFATAADKFSAILKKQISNIPDNFLLH